MNSIHDQCPNRDSKTVLSQKLAKCIVCTATAQPARTGRACMAVSWPCRGSPTSCRGRDPSRIAGAERRIVGAGRRVAGVVPGRVVGAVAVSQYSPCLAPLLPCHDTPDCIVTRPASQASPQSQYTYCIAIQWPNQPCSLSHNTVCVLRHTYRLAIKPSHSQYTNCIAIQFQQPSQLAIQLILQYKT